MRTLKSPRPSGPLKLAPELLESRLNLSAASILPLPATINFLQPIRIVGQPSNQTLKAASLPLAGATAAAGQTTIPIASYSAIANCSLELQPGQSQSDIGYVSAGGAYVEYTITAPVAGTYNLSMGLASYSGANVQILANSTVQGNIQTTATNSWSSYTTGTGAIQLAAGTNVLRLASQNGTQYNLNGITLTLLSPTSSTLTPVDSSPAAAIPITAIGDNTAIPITAYSAISSSRLEYQSGVPDIGYVSSNGAYVEYTINVATAGTYSLSAGVADVAAATFNVSSGGTSLASFVAPSTGSWQNFDAYSQNITLAAGQQTLRFTATNSSQYNLSTIQLVRQIPAPVPAAPVPVTPAAPAPITPPAVTITQRWMTSFNEIDVVASSGNDSILVTQSGSALTITANGQSQQVAASGELVIWAGAGNDSITVDSSVSLDTRLYGGAGNDILTDLTRGQATIVSIGGGADTLTGNGINTSYWADSSDNVVASAIEQSAGGVHIVSAFYQNAATGAVPLQLSGPSLIEPASAGSGFATLTNSSFFGLGPSQNDISQGQASDCYFLTALQSLARLQPGMLLQMGVDLGDGTYAIEFKRGGVAQYVRVDGDLPTASGGGLEYNHLGSSGDQWASIFEKAYAVFRTGQNTYASLNYGFMTPVYNDLGVSASTFSLSADQNAFYNMAAAKLAAGKAVDICTNATIAGNAPLIASHTYSIVNTWRDSSGTVWVTLRNPWGFDGFTVDSNPGDGLLTMTYASLQANAIFGTVMT